MILSTESQKRTPYNPPHLRSHFENRESVKSLQAERYWLLYKPCWTTLSWASDAVFEGAVVKYLPLTKIHIPLNLYVFCLLIIPMAKVGSFLNFNTLTIVDLDVTLTLLIQNNQPIIVLLFQIISEFGCLSIAKYKIILFQFSFESCIHWKLFFSHHLWLTEIPAYVHLWIPASDCQQKIDPSCPSINQQHVIGTS